MFLVVYFHVYAIELRITTLSVCHIHLAQSSLGVSYYTSGLISVLLSHVPHCSSYRTEDYHCVHGNYIVTCLRDLGLSDETCKVHVQ